MNTQLISGTVGNDGSRVEGEGFTVTKDQTGIYHVVFTISPQFSNLISVVATQWGVAGVPSTLDNVVVQNPAATGFTVYTGDDTGKLQDRGFFFIAVGTPN